MNAHPGRHGKQPALAASGSATGDLSQRNPDGMAGKDPTRRLHRIPGELEILRHDIAGPERNDAQRDGGSGKSLDHVEDGAITATDKHGVVALGCGSPGLRSSGAVFPGLQDVDRSTRLAKNLEHAGNISTPCTRSLEYGINKEQDLFHGALELRRFFPLREHDLF